MRRILLSDGKLCNGWDFYPRHQSWVEENIDEAIFSVEFISWHCTLQLHFVDVGSDDVNVESFG